MRFLAVLLLMACQGQVPPSEPATPVVTPAIERSTAEAYGVVIDFLGAVFTRNTDRALRFVDHDRRIPVMLVAESLSMPAPPERFAITAGQETDGRVLAVVRLQYAASPRDVELLVERVNDRWLVSAIDVRAE